MFLDQVIVNEGKIIILCIFLLDFSAVLGRQPFLFQFLAYIDWNSLDLWRLPIGLDQHNEQL